MSSHSRFTIDLADLTKDMSLTDINARPQTQKRVRPSRAAPKIEQRDFVRGKGPLARVGKAKTTKRPYSTIESRESTTDIEPEHQEDHSEHPAGQIYREGDPGFEAAYRASIMARRRRQEGGQPHRQVHHARQYVPDSPPTRRTPQDDVSDAELLGYSEDRTSVAPYTQSNAFPAPRVPAPPRNPANSPTPPPRPRRRNPMTGLLFEPLHRRPEALSGYSDTPVRSRGSSVRSSRVAPSTTVHAPEDNYGRAGATRTPNTGFPVNPDNRPPQTYYERSPGGSYYHDDDGSETPIGPTSSPGVSFTETRPAHGHIQRINRAPYPSRDAQIVGPSFLNCRVDHATNNDASRQTTRHSDPINDPINDPTNQGELAPDHRVSRPPEGTRRYEDLSLAEIRRARALREMITGFVGQDDERVRRKKQGSTDDDE